MKSVITITARMKSTRLPKKVTRTLEGKPMIEHMIERLQRAEKPEEIILCTSPLEDDNVLEEEAEKMGIPCFRGDPVDVLKRLLNAATEHTADFIVSTTADNPLVDPVYIDKMIEKFEETNADYITCPGLPLGTFAYGVKVTALQEVCERKTEEDTEIWGEYFIKTEHFKKEIVPVEEQDKAEHVRLTVDTTEDFQLMQSIFKELYTEESAFSLQRVLKLLKEKPELLKINQAVHQKESTITARLKDQERNAEQGVVTE